MSLFRDPETGDAVDFEIRDVVLAGYTGRDQEAVQRHVDELAAHGVPAPARVPAFYRATPSLVVADDSIDVLGSGSSGEVEFILLRSGGQLWVGLGSDHTDRELEGHSVTYAKQLCPKVVCPELWRFSDVRPHWDELTLRAFVGDERTLYQEGPVADMLEPEDILERVQQRTARGLDNVLVFSGTLPLVGDLQLSARFAAELSDARTGDSLSLDYQVNVLETLD